MRRTLTIVAVLLLSASVPARAEDFAGALDLYKQGVTLEAEKKWDDACHAFLESEKRRASTATELHLATCSEALGKTATAFGYYVHVATAGNDDEKAKAGERLKPLSERLTRLLVRAAPTPSLVVTCGALELPLDSAIPIDPGACDLVAEAPGKVRWSKHLTIPAGPATVTEQIPPLVDATTIASPAPTTTSSPEIDTNTGGARRPVFAVIAGVGLATTLVGLLVEHAGKKKQDDGHTACESFRASTGAPSGTCSGDANAMILDGRKESTLGWAIAGLGGAMAVSGVVLFFTARSSPATVAIGPRQVSFRWVF